MACRTVSFSPSNSTVEFKTNACPADYYFRDIVFCHVVVRSLAKLDVVRRFESNASKDYACSHSNWWICVASKLSFIRVQKRQQVGDVVTYPIKLATLAIHLEDIIRRSSYRRKLAILAEDIW